MSARSLVADVPQSFSTPIEAPADLCYAAIAHFEAYRSWASPTTSTNYFLDRYPDRHACRVEFQLDIVDSAVARSTKG